MKSIYAFALAVGMALLSGMTFAQDVVAGLDSKDMVKCYGCHDDKEDQHTKGAHANTNCATCHAGAAEHSKVAKAKDPVKKPQRPDAEACLTCHKNDAKRMNWKFADHHKAGLECRDCHGMHTPKDIKRLDLSLWRSDKNTALCATCHEDVLARFNMRSHHPVKEGGLTCTSCHDQHGGKQTDLDTKTAKCTQCHQAVRGPKTFEHPPVAEDCSNCHTPHGSPNRKLLSVAQPMLCLQCHALPGNRHGQTGLVNNTQRITGAVLRECTSCHGQVHGSSIDQHLRH
jgi:DmsE family decaheme c-type cytochrome